MRDFGRWPLLQDFTRRDFLRDSLLLGAGFFAACASPGASPAKVPVTSPAIALTPPSKEVSETRPMTIEEVKRSGWQYAVVDLPNEPPQQLTLLTAQIPIGATYYYIPFQAEATAVQALGHAVASIGIWARKLGNIAYKGLLIDAALYLATTPRVIQDMSEGQIQYTWKGQLVTVDSVDGKVVARPLARVQVDTKADIKNEIKPTPENNLRIAVVDDSSTVRDVVERVLSSRIKGAVVVTYPNCEAFILALKDPALQYRLAIVDYEMGSRFMNGSACVIQLRALRPDMIVIGSSVNNVSDEFTKVGAKGFIPKDISVTDLINAVQNFLK